VADRDGSIPCVIPDPLEYPLRPDLSGDAPLTARVQTPDETPDPYLPPAPEEDDWLVAPQPRPSRSFEQMWGWGNQLTWVSGLILAL
jgi:hypothetical protein